MRYDVVIAGAGASGLCAAIEAARQGTSVLILERMDKPAKKILATGNGRCNYTNQVMHEGCYRGDVRFIQAFLEKCPWASTVAFFEKLGIFPKERDGYFYPNSEQAASVAEVLLDECAQLGVKIALSEPVLKTKAHQGGFVIETESRRIEAKALVLSCGGRAYPKLGSDGSGYNLAKMLGHTLVPVVPALCGLSCDGLFDMKAQKFWKQIAGVRADASVTLYIDGRKEAADTGQLQLTGYGISGIPVFQISRYAAYGLRAAKDVRAVIDFFPKLDKKAMFSMLKQRSENAGQKNMDHFLTGLVNSKLIPVFLKLSGLYKDMPAVSLKNVQLSQLVRALKHFEVKITGTNSFDEAQVCAGGIDTAEIDVNTMASNMIPGLYIVGELLDVDGICGGYNLHFAFQSGRIAGYSAAQRVKGGNLC